jgi:hypothetical protein
MPIGLITRQFPSKIRSTVSYCFHDCAIVLGIVITEDLFPIDLEIFLTNFKFIIRTPEKVLPPQHIYQRKFFINLLYVKFHSEMFMKGENGLLALFIKEPFAEDWC